MSGISALVMNAHYIYIYIKTSYVLEEGYMQCLGKINVWPVILENQAIGELFISANLHAEIHRNPFEKATIL